MRLFSYCIPVDDGAAPNPYWKKCTLVICKPVIRRVAEEGDWVVGLGSRNINGIDYSGKVVYAMKIAEIKTLAEYDEFCRNSLTNKIPDLNHHEYSRKVGDCIYNFAQNSKGILRPSVHNKGNRKTDLGGMNALISDHFYYFGKKAIELPQELWPIIKQGQGHRSDSNEPYKDQFVKWIENLGYKLNGVYGKPQIELKFMKTSKDSEICAITRCKSAKEDEELGEQDA